VDFEQVEDKIIAELKDSVAYLRTVETYAGQLAGELSKLSVRFPAAFVVYGGSDFKWLDGPNFEETARFSVLLCSKNPRGGERLRKEEQGAYDLIEDALSALTNKTFGLAIERLTPVKRSLVFIGKGIAVYGVDFQTAFDTGYAWEE
jgi:phage gp37-like protein